MDTKRLTRGIRRLLEFGGNTQLVIAITGAIGVNGLLVAVVGSVLSPLTGWDIAILVAIFLAATPLTFPLSAVALNAGLSQVEKSRRREILDTPLETARKAVENCIRDARRLQSTVPSVYPSDSERQYHLNRYNHFLGEVDQAILRTDGEWAAKCFAVDDRPEAWRGNRDYTHPDVVSERYTRDIGRLERLRDELPVDRAKWCRYSTSLDVPAGQTLLAFLRAGSDDSHGAAEFQRWVASTYGSMSRDGMSGAHVFAPETHTDITTRQARIDYVENGVSELERLWRSL